MGGPRAFYGRLPIPAHEHMYITQEMFELRHGMLRESIEEHGISGQLMEEWLVMI